MANDVWTPSILGKMKTLLSRGLSTAEIGKKIGVSKNAVVGKLNRLGWNSKSAEEPKNKAKSIKHKAEIKGKAKTAAPVKKAITPTKKLAKQIAKKSAKQIKAPVKKSALPAKKGTAPVSNKKIAAPVNKKTVVPAKSGAALKSIPKANSKTLAMHQRIIQHSMEMAAMRPDQCRWPIGDPDSEGFHFCGAPVFVGKPYCYEHCKVAYQFQQPTKKKA